MFWEIYESRRAQKNIDKLPRQLLEKYEFWKSTAEMTGPSGLSRFSGFHDHALSGQWNGYRSSYLNQKYRVIYQVFQRETEIHVFDVNAHDYRRKG